MDNIMFRGCLVMIGYRDMLVDLVLLNFKDFDVIFRDRFVNFLLCLY